MGVSDGDLLSYGVPSEWLSDVRKADEDSLLVLADHLPAEAAEALLADFGNGRSAEASGGDPTGGPIHSATRMHSADSGHERRRRTGTGARLPMGEVDRLSSPGAAAMG
jgi:hypothetical protein